MLTWLHSYALQWLIVLPLEIIGASITISYWDNVINKAVFVTVFITVIMAINLCGVRGYGEAEFVFAIVKVTAVIGFMYVHQFTVTQAQILWPVGRS